MRLNPDEKAAKIILDTVNDYKLNLDMIGFYIANSSHGVLYNRLETVFESARQQKEKKYANIISQEN
jgi:hypothetical protein